MEHDLAFKPSLRKVDNLLIIFRDKHTVIIKAGDMSVVFHRWFDRKQYDYSRAWKPFCQALRKRRSLSLGDCCTLADKYKISMQSFRGDVEKEIRKIVNSAE